MKNILHHIMFGRIFEVFTADRSIVHASVCLTRTANGLFTFRKPDINTKIKNDQCEAKEPFQYYFPVHQEISLC